MTDRPTFQARIWGARGTLASFSPTTSVYGGNTACVEVLCGDDVIILDAGSGIRMAGDSLMKRVERKPSRGKSAPKRKCNLLFTHCHYDHISGLPFFAPFFDPSFEIEIWSGHLTGADKTRRMLNDYMRAPFFPVGPEVFSAQLTYHDFEPEDVLHPVEGVTVRTLALNHHNGCVGYRVEFDGRSVCYITDTTHIPDEPDLRISELCRDTDLMIYDGTYTDAEFPQFHDFGHSTWEEGMRLAKLAGAKRYLIFHHRPSRTDAAMAKIEEECRRYFRRSWAAREGQVIKL